MFEQFLFAHFSGIVFWQNKKIVDKAAIDQIITQALIESRKLEQPIDVRDFNYYYQVVQELQLIVIASIPKHVLLPQIKDIIAGLTITFIQEFEAQIRSCDIDFDPDNFQSFAEPFNANLRSLITTGQLTTKPVAKQTEQDTKSDVTIKSVENAPKVEEPKVELTAEQKEEAKERMKKIAEQMKSQKASQMKLLQESLKEMRDKNKPIQQIEKKVEKTAEEQASVSISEPVREEIFKHTDQLDNIFKGQKKQESIWERFTKKTLDEESLTMIQNQIRQTMIDSNVAAEIVDSMMDQIGSQLIQVSTLQRAKTVVRQIVKDHIAKIIRVDSQNLLLNALDHQQKRSDGRATRPFVITIVGINGMGKTTTIAKLLYKFTQAKLKCFVCACDSFRSGAIEQLQVHADRLGCKMFQQGYGKNPSSIAQYGILEATKSDYDVVFIDTAGRMHNNAALMQELGKLVKDNKPDRVVYVGEALTGSTGIIQLKEFDQQLTSQAGRKIDGIVLSKFDTVGDKVGTALNFCYASGLPIYFIGIGQSYPDLGVLDPEELVNLIV